MQDNQVSGGEQGVKRRTLVKGAAWAAPVVTFAAAAPMAAASPPPVAPSVGNGSCKHSPDSRYHIELVFSNSLSCATDVTITYFVVDPSSGQDVPFTDPPVDTEFTIPANDSLSWVYDSDVVGNMANGEVDLTYTYTDCQGKVVAESTSINVDSLNPCKFGYPHTSTP
ncbi:hypothetical protein [Janibacter sp. G1551]|uniref:hypothetical protein n=1 Tax=Janibacter sp. G1551 TaxID=3420440 RepID=UPI003D034C05